MTSDYDPMIYDAMREAANRLVGFYIARHREAEPHEAQQLLDQMLAVRAEADEVDPHSLGAVLAKRDEFVERFRQVSA